MRACDDEVHGGKEERGERAARAERGVSGPRGAAAHAHLCQIRHQANFGWDRAVELVVLQVPAQRRVRGAPTESVRWRARRRGGAR